MLEEAAQALEEGVNLRFYIAAFGAAAGTLLALAIPLQFSSLIVEVTYADQGALEPGDSARRIEPGWRAAMIARTTHSKFGEC